MAYCFRLPYTYCNGFECWFLWCLNSDGQQFHQHKQINNRSPPQIININKTTTTPHINNHSPPQQPLTTSTTTPHLNNHSPPQQPLTTSTTTPYNHQTQRRSLTCGWFLLNECFFSWWMINVIMKVQGFEPRSGQIKDYKICICGFSAKHAAFKEQEQTRVGS